MRETSVLAYQNETDSGGLTRTRAAVLALLTKNGPMTGSEVNATLGTSSGHKRLSELERGGFVHSNTLRPCRITGREAIAWTPTGLGGLIPSSGGRKTPGKRQIAEAVRQVYRLIELRGNIDRNYIASTDLMETLKWLERKSGVKL